MANLKNQKIASYITQENGKLVLAGLSLDTIQRSAKKSKKSISETIFEYGRCFELTGRNFPKTETK